MTTAVLHTVAELRAAIAAWRKATPSGRVALVPTMGALHEGHLQLMDHAHGLAQAVVVSVFVNPTQFTEGEDFDTYPRTLTDDVRACEQRGVRWVFAPNAAEMYPVGDDTTVRVQSLGAGLCGVSRPHFFGGVARVVLKLLNIAGAEIAVFGEKDYQQLQVIRRMVRDTHHTTEIIGAPIVREADGLAMSSRNRNLTSDERVRAPELYRALSALVATIEKDGSPAAVESALVRARQHIEVSGARIDYLAIVDADDLIEMAEIRRPARVAVAAWLGATRLIDNLAIIPSSLPNLKSLAPLQQFIP